MLLCKKQFICPFSVSIFTVILYIKTYPCRRSVKPLRVHKILSLAPISRACYVCLTRSSNIPSSPFRISVRCSLLQVVCADIPGFKYLLFFYYVNSNCIAEEGSILFIVTIWLKLSEVLKYICIPSGFESPPHILLW